MTYKSYVLKRGDQYCRFASYSEVRLVDSPLKATLYTRKKDAEYRKNEPRGFHKYVNTGHISTAALEIVEIEMEVKGEVIV